MENTIVKLKKFNIKKAYIATLNFGKFRKWSSKKNRYFILQYKFEFVKEYFEEKKFDYKKTKYFKFLEKTKIKNFIGVYEGSPNFAYSNPHEQCLRFIKLIISFKKKMNFISKNIDNKKKLAEFILLNTYMINKNYPVETYDFRIKKIIFSKESKRYTRLDILFNKLNLYKLIPLKFYYKSVFPSGIFYKKKIIIKNGTHRLALFYYLNLKKKIPDFFYFWES